MSSSSTSWSNTLLLATSVVVASAAGMYLGRRLAAYPVVPHTTHTTPLHFLVGTTSGQTYHNRRTGATASAGDDAHENNHTSSTTAPDTFCGSCSSMLCKCLTDGPTFTLRDGQPDTRHVRTHTSVMKHPHSSSAPIGPTDAHASHSPRHPSLPFSPLPTPAVHRSPLSGSLADSAAYPPPPIYRIVITGGPCSGKSTSMAFLRRELEAQQFSVYTVPEVATMLMTGGVRLWVTNEERACEMATVRREQECRAHVMQLAHTLQQLQRVTGERVSEERNEDVMSRRKTKKNNNDNNNNTFSNSSSGTKGVEHDEEIKVAHEGDADLSGLHTGATKRCNAASCAHEECALHDRQDHPLHSETEPIAASAAAAASALYARDAHDTHADLCAVMPTPTCSPSKVIIQRIVLQLMLALEDGFYELAALRQRPAVLLFDRGTMDGKAYCTSDEWDAIVRASGHSECELRDIRYDAVVHLITAAVGATAFYTLDNNHTRRETAEEAAALDAATRQAWRGHFLMEVIDNSTDFATKLQRVAEFIRHVVGVAEVSTCTTPAVTAQDVTTLNITDTNNVTNSKARNEGSIVSAPLSGHVARTCGLRRQWRVRALSAGSVPEDAVCGRVSVIPLIPTHPSHQREVLLQYMPERPCRDGPRNQEEERATYLHCVEYHPSHADTRTRSSSSSSSISGITNGSAWYEMIDATSNHDDASNGDKEDCGSNRAHAEAEESTRGGVSAGKTQQRRRRTAVMRRAIDRRAFVRLARHYDATQPVMEKYTQRFLYKFKQMTIETLTKPEALGGVMRVVGPVDLCVADLPLWIQVDGTTSCIMHSEAEI